MKNKVKFEISKFKSDNGRWLSFSFDFSTEEFADEFIDAMDEKLKNEGYDWRFSRCPWINKGEKYEYGDSIDIPFESGSMTENKIELLRIFRETKKEFGIK